MQCTVQLFCYLSTASIQTVRSCLGAMHCPAKHTLRRVLAAGKAVARVCKPQALPGGVSAVRAQGRGGAGPVQLVDKPLPARLHCRARCGCCPMPLLPLQRALCASSTPPCACAVCTAQWMHWACVKQVQSIANAHRHSPTSRVPQFSPKRCVASEHMALWLRW